MQLFATLLILLPYAIGVSAFQVPLVVQPPNGAGVLTSASIAATPDVQCNQTGTIIAMPPAQTFNGTKPIPDDVHPYMAPGPNDQRGPCPALNTLANHGYIPRNGITTFEEIINATTEAFNLDPLISATLVSINMLARGNPFVNKLSIGSVSQSVPPLPCNIDGQPAGGIAHHGRFEGDASMTRADALIGDNRHFQDILYDYLLLQLGKYGDNGPDGNHTVFNMETILAIKNENFVFDQAANKGFDFSARRMFSSYAEIGFILDIFANGTTKNATMPIIGSFFRNETFPPNWNRAASPVTLQAHGQLVDHIYGNLSIVPGKNNAQGTYTANPAPPTPFNTSFLCEAYYDQAQNLPGVLTSILARPTPTDIFKENVKFLLDIPYTVFGCTTSALPAGPTGV